jgi:hypothetical protein
MYFSANISRVIKSRRMRWTIMEERKDAQKVLVERPEEKKPLGGPRRRWKDNVKIDLQDVRWGGMGTVLFSLRIMTDRRRF